jgi:hypothetical protein
MNPIPFLVVVVVFNDREKLFLRFSGGNLLKTGVQGFLKQCNRKMIGV